MTLETGMQYSEAIYRLMDQLLQAVTNAKNNGLSNDEIAAELKNQLEDLQS